MTKKPSAKSPRFSSAEFARADIVRQLIAAALLRAISVQGGTNAAAAKWLRISPRTMHSWAHGVRPISVETVLACPQLAVEFRRALCAHEHNEPFVPYVVKKKARR